MSRSPLPAGTSVPHALGFFLNISRAASLTALPGRPAWLVRVLGRVMKYQGHDVPMGDTVAAQLVGHETHRLLPLTLQEFPKVSPCRVAISTGWTRISIRSPS